MRLGLMKTATSVAMIGSALIASGCARVPGQQGFIADSSLVDGIQAGIDTRASVEKTLGRPTFASQFTANEWYYVSRSTKQLAFATPQPVSQMILRVQFDSAGNVTNVSKSGVEKVARISPNGDKTPTLGRERGFFEDVFGNIGQVGAGGAGAGQGGGTADNPN
jgi:outer membrane protein assembly factor BamE (lipoprotein component of BamABCDE complex)